ncbi:efflux transporter outer membrane subunit [Curvibacter sp. APW13]|uniref:efflux transporter outer membrane subunit n=1 Tax=Curvibacter sp. APW13 TaxID=3077236 RepID=UPI0028DF40CA|nr:efflux transporter outer membrane subunit [Curvibacter sp. APW13]MDT8992320.1 efflux transporter outer membrane subunit [Curvibacter sp. APW13]
MKRHFPIPGLNAVALAAAVLLVGCASSSGIAPSKAQAIDAKTLGPTAAADAAPLAIDNSPWWQAFGDRQLDALVEAALANNPNLRLAQARVSKAQSFSDVADAALLPQVNAGLDATRQKYTAVGAVPAPLAGNIYESGTLQLTAGWELDFFGKYDAALKASLGQVRAAQADAAAARMLLASNITRQYFALARIQAQLVVAERALAQRNQTMRLVQDRVNAGLDTQLELRSAESALPEARMQIEQLREQQALARNAIAALVSKPNSDLALANTAQTAIKQIATPNTVALDLVGRRPDVAAARARIEAATQDVANARTQFYPNINLNAFAGWSAIGLEKLTTVKSEQWGVGPAIRLPIFDAGRLRANLRAKNADLDAAVESYNAQVIDAVRDVSDQLASQRAIALQQAEQVQAQHSAEAAYAIALQRFEAGLGNYLQVLSAETAVLAQRRAAVDLQGRLLDTQVQLIRALGGSLPAVTASAP